LQQGRPRAELVAELLANPADGAIKLYLVTTLLRHRRDNPALYAAGAYRPLEADGSRKNQVVAYARMREGQTVIVAAGRLLTGLMGSDGTTAPVGPDAWEDTRLWLPDPALPRTWRDLLTDEVVAVGPENELNLGQVFRRLPLALLVPEGLTEPAG
jgi:(1->4)-alpha-D-glucan 1-alpha-D-glucosylmutase